MRISDWSSDVCSSDLDEGDLLHGCPAHVEAALVVAEADVQDDAAGGHPARGRRPRRRKADRVHHQLGRALAGILAAGVEHGDALGGYGIRSEEHTSELQSLMRIS